MKDVLIYNALGEQIIRLAQWDRDVYVNIKDPGITTNYPVHFFNKNSERAYVVDSTYEDGKLKAKIPDHLLREPYTICGYIQRNDGDIEHRSDFRFIIGVVPKPQPSDYILRSDPDYIEIDTLIDKFKELKKAIDDLNIIEGVSVNGEPLEINDRSVDIKIPTKVSELENDKKYQTKAEVDTELKKKVDKVDGKGLSSNDFTDELKKKVQELLNVATYEEVSEMLDEIYNGHGAGSGGTGSGSYVLPVATKDTLGGIKVGTGLQITKDGKLSPAADNISTENVATDNEVTEMLDEVYP